MSSDELFAQPKGPSAQWNGLESRVNRLLEGIVQLRNANAQLMKENVLLKNQLRDLSEGSNGSDGSSAELLKLRRQYEEALLDLKQVRQNLQRLEALAAEMKLEG